MHCDYKYESGAACRQRLNLFRKVSCVKAIQLAADVQELILVLIIKKLQPSLTAYVALPFSADESSCYYHGYVLAEMSVHQVSTA